MAVYKHNNSMCCLGELRVRKNNGVQVQIRFNFNRGETKHQLLEVCVVGKIIHLKQGVVTRHHFVNNGPIFT